MDKSKLTLISNDGWNYISFRIKDAFKTENDNLLLVEVIMTGKNWDIVDQLRIRARNWNKVKDYSLIMPQFIVYESKLKKLHKRLEKWLKTPIDQLPMKPVKVTEELSGFDYQSLKINFGTKNYNLSNIGHTECLVSYRLNRIAGECHFVTDVTCIQSFADEQMDFLYKQNHT